MVKIVVSVMDSLRLMTWSSYQKMDVFKMASLVSMFSKVRAAAQRGMQPEALVCFRGDTPGLCFTSTKRCFPHRAYLRKSFFF